MAAAPWRHTHARVRDVLTAATRRSPKRRGVSAASIARLSLPCRGVRCTAPPRHTRDMAATVALPPPRWRSVCGHTAAPRPRHSGDRRGRAAAPSEQPRRVTGAPWPPQPRHQQGRHSEAARSAQLFLAPPGPHLHPRLPLPARVGLGGPWLSSLPPDRGSSPTTRRTAAPGSGERSMSRRLSQGVSRACRGPASVLTRRHADGGA